MDAAAEDEQRAFGEIPNEKAVNKASENEGHSSSTAITKATNEKCAGKQSLSNNKHTLSDIHIDTTEVDREVQIEGNGMNDSSHMRPNQNANNVKNTSLKFEGNKEVTIVKEKKFTSPLNSNGIEKQKLEQTMSVPTFGTKLQRSIRQRIQSLSTTNGLPLVSFSFIFINCGSGVFLPTF